MNYSLELLFTLSIRKILVRLRAMRAPCIIERSQKKTNCIVIARAGGSGANNTEISLPPHCKLKILVFEYGMVFVVVDTFPNL